MVSIRDIFKEEKRQREQIVKTIEAKNKLAMNIWKGKLICIIYKYGICMLIIISTFS